MLSAISTPTFKLLEDPLRSQSDTVPPVVGVQVKVVDWPAVTLKPFGRVKGLGFWAKTMRGAATSATIAENFILMILNES